MQHDTPLRFLIVESETAAERDTRRRSAGKSAGESFAATLEQLSPRARIELVTPSDPDADIPNPDEIATHDAVFLSGSPLHVYDETPETRRQIAFMRAVFASGTPSFGSCAGLQVAVAAAGGKVRSMPFRQEAGIARRLMPTEAGRDHPLLSDRPAVWDAPAIHGDEVEDLPPDATLLATSLAVRVQAAEIRSGDGIFWGVQYHPELSPGEIGAALRRQAETLVEDGLCRDADDVEAQAALFDRLHDAPGDHATRWRLGIDAEFAEEPRRRTELIAFIERLVIPTRMRRRQIA
ncbi:type 1 glutamine amidotransferase [Sphingomonas sp. KR1UV-12]|uniref:Type 1 glutamine amidotransferase n=1 Tax=Sphingomonas aurea TaxID=3063994 RepID=A0ABT9EP04_9SPHN|nr:type 1 glutamine amidotransferase [Sphingomonas sp. KR1UV-12]MDP1028537.1 type 1 glutamine amidotransferase [Sphingomonas sp. KR1UV-12]